MSQIPINIILFFLLFFNLLEYLHNSKRSFCVIFRTFGTDLPEITEEINAYSTGKHKSYPHIKFDGSQPSGINFKMTEPNSFGSFIRNGEDSNSTILLWNITAIPTLQDSLESILQIAQKNNKNIDVDIASSFATIYQSIIHKSKSHRVLALQDNYAW